MYKKLILFILLFASPALAFTLEWEHDCVDAIGFNLYRNEAIIATVLCPETSATLGELNPGKYFVVAYNDTGESPPSGPLWLSDASNTISLTAYSYNSTKYDYNSSGLIIYKGEHTAQDALDSDTEWTITKYYYTNNVVVGIRVRTTSWTDRAVGW